MAIHASTEAIPAAGSQASQSGKLHAPGARPAVGSGRAEVRLTLVLTDGRERLP